MSKKLIFGLALATVLISGPFIKAQANVSEACWAGFCSAGSNTNQPRRDFDKPDATRQGAHPYDPTAPEPMGWPGW